ncbi:SDR family NAD(P)-dependent oxidoreductase [Populibacterium corticicola]|jgi:short-subunit dehydrogenase|uniref:SDR family NAD(P)-dependent oxidoreductase n=1 Tax=Populibacterium corticicola TaxID=1812826 RepID=A0ABW5XGT4_9MICO
MATALITGASAGLGLEFAWQLASARHNLVLVARNRERLEGIAQQIESVAGVHVEVLPADLSQRDQVEVVAKRLRSQDNPVGLLVNNAGYAVHKRFLASDIGEQEKLLAVMVNSVMVLSQAAAQQMIERGRGAILNVSSVAALTASGTYSAHKAWVRSFTEGLAVELNGTGVTATALCPGFVHTEFHERAGIDYSGFPEIAWLNADQVVATALQDVRRGAVISTPSLRYQLASGLLRTLPRAAVRALQSNGGAGRIGSEK